MSDPVTFVSTLGGRLEAFIGTQLVGFVAPYTAGGTALGRVEATCQMRLPIKGAIELPKHMTSIIAARRTLLTRLADWHAEADPVRYAGMILALRAQAEGER